MQIHSLKALVYETQIEPAVITATKRFNNIMAITRRATEDFCSGVRTEFRRLVDEITESRAFIRRLEKMLGKKLNKKST